MAFHSDTVTNYHTRTIERANWRTDSLAAGGRASGMQGGTYAEFKRSGLLGSGVARGESSTHASVSSHALSKSLRGSSRFSYLPTYGDADSAFRSARRRAQAREPLERRTLGADAASVAVQPTSMDQDAEARRLRAETRHHSEILRAAVPDSHISAAAVGLELTTSLATVKPAALATSTLVSPLRRAAPRAVASHPAVESPGFSATGHRDPGTHVGERPRRTPLDLSMSLHPTAGDVASLPWSPVGSSAMPLAVGARTIRTQAGFHVSQTAAQHAVARATLASRAQSQRFVRIREANYAAAHPEMVRAAAVAVRRA